MTLYRVMLGAAVPIFLSMVTGMVGALVGTAVLGRHATATLAAFALAAAVLTPASAAVAGALRGLMPFVAPHRDDPAAAVPILRDARWLSLSVGTAGAAAVACTPLIARVSGAPPEVLAEFGALPLLLALYVLITASNGGANAVLIALGRSRQVLWSSLAATATDVVLTVALVPVAGLTGAGIAFVASGVVGVSVANLCLRRVPGLSGLGLWPGRPRPREILALARVGIPLSGTILVKFAVLGVVTYAAARTGAQGAAAHAILTTLTGFLMLASLAVAHASVPHVARAATPGEVRRVTRTALLLAVAGASAGGLALALAAGPLTGLFTQDAAVRGLVATLIPLMLASAMADAGQAVLGFGLTGLKKASASLIYFALGYGTLAAAAVPVVSAWGLAGLWTALIVTNGLLVVLQGSGFLRHSARVRVPAVPARA